MDSYLEDLGHSAGEGTVGDVDGGANVDGLGEVLVGAGNASGVTLDVVISNDLKFLASLKSDGLSLLEHTSADLRALGVEHDGASLVGALLEGLSQVVNRLTVGLSASEMRIRRGQNYGGLTLWSP